MNKPQRWALIRKISSNAPDLAKQAALRSAKYEAGHKLYGLLEGMPNPAVVTIDETVKLGQYRGIDHDFALTDEITVAVEITPVEYRRVVIEKSLFDPSFALGPSPNFWKRLKYAFGRKNKPVY